MLGGLLEYLEWPASWVVDDQEDGFQLALELERRLIMSECENPIATALDGIRECLCLLARGGIGLPPDGTGVPDGWSMYDENPSAVEYNVGDPPSGFATWDDWLAYHCKAAQYLADVSYRLVSQTHNLLVTFGTVTWGAMVGILVALGISAPIGILMAAVAALAVGGITIYLDAQKDWLLEHRKEIVCAVFSANTAQQARANLKALFDAQWTLAQGDRYLVELCYWYTTMNKAYDGGFTEAQLNEYDDEYCSSCEAPPGLLCDVPLSVEQYSGTFTPWGDFAAFGVGPGWPDCPLGTQTLAGADIPNEYSDNTYDVTGTVYGRSGFDVGSTVGYVTLRGYKPLTEEWETVCAVTFTTTEGPMVATIVENTAAGIDMTVYSLLRVEANNQPASCKEDPGPGFVLEGFCFTFELTG